MISVLLVDDHDVVRSAIKHLLSGAADVQVVGEAEDGHSAIKFVRESHPEIVLLDLSMPGMSGLETAYRLSRLSNPPKVIILTSYSAQPFPSLLIKLGANGYITKDASSEDLLEAVRTVHKGGQYLYSPIAQQLALDMVQTQEGHPFSQFNHREFEILWMLCRGLSVDDIAKELFLSRKTVHSYRYKLFKRLGVTNDVELTKLAMRYGLVGNS